MKLSPPILCHLALTVTQLEACVKFYTEVLGMKIEWQPDADNIYLTGGRDNLALHRASPSCSEQEQNHLNNHQRLDHMGFILPSEASVDQWYERFVNAGIRIKAKPRTHRDGARSFYAYDPDGTVIQMIYHPPLANVAISF